MADLRKPFILIIATLFVLAAFIVNTWYSWQMFRYNLNVVPPLQRNQFLGSNGFIVFMNIISNIFNPVVCAGYIMAFYLLSHRRFQILVFLIWFIFLSVFLTFMKSLIQQARPYWIAENDVQMLQWTCYTEFGCPSGHSMLGLILIEFMIRYFTRAYNLKGSPRAILFVLGILLQGLVVFSRIILGMHAINQVLFGVMLGFYFLIPYYMYMQKFILKMCLKTCSRSYRKQNLIMNTLLIILMVAITMVTTFGPSFNRNQEFYLNIQKFEKCQNIKLYQSFQYKCLQDASLVMAVFGIIYGLVFLRKQERLMKVITYERNSKRYIARLIISALMALIPVIFFMNPLWKKIELPDDRMAIMLYFLQSLAMLLGNYVLVGLAPAILQKLKLESYHNHQQGKQFLFYSPAINSSQSLSSSSLNQLQTKQKLLRQYGNNDSINVPLK